MIEALFNQPNYLSAKKALDVTVLRQEAISRNIANLETPGYRRLDVQPSFQDELRRASKSADARQIASLTPSLAVDAHALPLGPDGNTVNLEEELIQLNQNTVAHSLELRLITGTLLKLRLAITGRPA